MLPRDSLRPGVSLTTSESLGIAPEELLQLERILAGYYADSIRDVVTSLGRGNSRSEVLPKVGQNDTNDSNSISPGKGSPHTDDAPTSDCQRYRR